MKRRRRVHILTEIKTHFQLEFWKEITQMQILGPRKYEGENRIEITLTTCIKKTILSIILYILAQLRTQSLSLVLVMRFLIPFLCPIIFEPMLTTLFTFSPCGSPLADLTQNMSSLFSFIAFNSLIYVICSCIVVQTRRINEKEKRFSSMKHRTNYISELVT